MSIRTPLVGAWLFGHLGIARVYTKARGRPTARDRPFILRRGQTEEDVARLVHKDLARSLKYARVWGKSGFDGQHVGREHRLTDGDVVELHACPLVSYDGYLSDFHHGLLDGAPTLRIPPCADGLTGLVLDERE